MTHFTRMATVIRDRLMLLAAIFEFEGKSSSSRASATGSGEPHRAWQSAIQATDSPAVLPEKFEVAIGAEDAREHAATFLFHGQDA